VQHQGEEALALVGALATDPPPLSAPSDSVYFDLFRHEIVWPRGLCLPPVALALALLVFAAVYRVPRLRAVALFRGTGTLAVTILLSAAFASAMLWVMFPMALLGPQFPAHPLPSMVAFVALAFALGRWCLHGCRPGELRWNGTPYCCFTEATVWPRSGNLS
jgi:hypothetical protein